MKTKKFQEHLEKRLSKAEITEIEKQAEFEYQALCVIQAFVAKAITEYVIKEKIGFNELVRRLGVSPTQVAKIQKGRANLTIASMAHIFGLLKKIPIIKFAKLS
jgi:hypothetical protein